MPYINIYYIEGTDAGQARGVHAIDPPTGNPGEAQLDFGYALAKISGVLRKAGFFVMAF